MIASLRGKLAVRAPDGVVVDVGGVGYLVLLSLGTYHELPEVGTEITLQIHTYVREDQITLFGFGRPGERTLFLHLLEVSGVGPKMALNALSGMAPSELVAAVLGGNEKALQTISGVGKRTAQRIIVDLKDKLAKADLGFDISTSGVPITPSGGNPHEADLIQALLSLGYKKSEIDRVLPIAGDDPRQSLPDQIRLALRELAPAGR